VALSLISLCSSGPTCVYIWCTIDPDGDDIIFLIKFFGFYVVGAGLLVGLLGMLAGICGLLEHHWEKRALALKAIAMEAEDEGDNVEEDDGETGEAKEQQEMLLPTTQRAYGVSDDIV